MWKIYEHMGNSKWSNSQLLYCTRRETAIIDGLLTGMEYLETVRNLEEIGVDPNIIDYLDPLWNLTTGWISNFRKIKEDFTIICTDKAAKMVSSFYGEDKIKL